MKTAPAKKYRWIKWVILSPFFLFALLISGFLLASYLIDSDTDFSNVKLAVGSKIYDKKNRLIGELFVQNRIPVTYDDFPEHLIQALLLREDKEFYSHNGFSLSGFSRALINNLAGKKIQGGSTITQQLATMLFGNKNDKTIMRKINELWWSFQLEKKYTKNEIIEIYLNYNYFGAGCFGIESACRYFFGHGVNDLTAAESAMIVIQIVKPELYNPYKNPDAAKQMQMSLMSQMTEKGYIDSKTAEKQITEYWNNLEWNKQAVNASRSIADNEHPHIMEFIRREIENTLSGKLDYYRDGLTIYTTIDLDAVAVAENQLKTGIKEVDGKYQSNKKDQSTYTSSSIMDIINLLSLQFPLTDVKNSSPSKQFMAFNEYTGKFDSILSLTNLFLPVTGLDETLTKANKKVTAFNQKNDITGAVIILDNLNGSIVALADGTEYGQSEFIRAIQGRIMPGSAFKPLFFSAALDTKRFHLASLIPNQAISLTTDDNKEYKPQNYFGYYSDQESFRNSLVNSYNIPAVRVLDAIGIETGRARASALLEMTQMQADFYLSKDFAFALGSSTVSPLQLAEAYSVFANQGVRKTPWVISKIVDANGRTAYEHKDQSIRVVSEQNAFLMTDVLKDVVKRGTLRNSFSKIGGSDKQIYAGKTGTTQNWSDAWTVGFSNLFTTAVWMGFDRPGNSLGTAQTGAGSAGPVWAAIMKNIHKNLSTSDYTVPGGIVKTKICSESGLLANEACGKKSYEEYFFEDSLPVEHCDLHPDKPKNEPAPVSQETGSQSAEKEKPQPDNSGFIIEHGEENF